MEQQENYISQIKPYLIYHSLYHTTYVNILNIIKMSFGRVRQAPCQDRDRAGNYQIFHDYTILLVMEQNQTPILGAVIHSKICYQSWFKLGQYKLLQHARPNLRDHRTSRPGVSYLVPIRTYWKSIYDKNINQ